MTIGLRRVYGLNDLHFITFSCYHRRPYLQCAESRTRFVELLSETRAKHSFRIGGYVVMPEHVHLLLSEPVDGLLSVAVQVLKQRVSYEMRRSCEHYRGGVGTQACAEALRFWERRYYDFNVWSQAKVKEKMDYMHQNPVKRGLVRYSFDWPWSSFCSYEKGEMGLIRIDPV
jgi:putative transposase